jgi:RecB family endonuclease NucS
VGLFGKFGYEQALSDYIANYPHYLEENLTPFPNSKIRERLFKDKTRADVLLIDKYNIPVIVECKQNAPTKEDIEQLKKYLRHLSKELGQKPRGILVHGGSPKLSTGVLKNIRGYKIDIINYKLDIEFRKSF